MVVRKPRKGGFAEMQSQDPRGEFLGGAKG
jgi:hypothetical protein